LSSKRCYFRRDLIGSFPGPVAMEQCGDHLKIYDVALEKCKEIHLFLLGVSITHAI
jgi:hypothetical protein